MLEQGLTIAQVGRDLGVHKTVIRDWVVKAKTAGLASSPAERSTAALDEENRRLRRENAILREEREILKKAAAFFAKETR